MSYKGWQTRHDPITMYFRETIPQDVKDDVMLGKKLAKGIYQVCEPTEQQVLNLIARAEKLGDDKLVQCLKSENPLFGAGLYQYSTGSGKVKVKTSPGIVKAVEQMLDDVEQITKCHSLST